MSEPGLAEGPWVPQPPPADAPTERRVRGRSRDDLVGSVRRWVVARRWALLLALLGGVAGIVLRAWILGGPLGDADLDEATVGVQAFRFNEGQFSAFFLNQNYGGTLEPFLVSLVFRAFGSSVLALKVVPMALAAVAAAITWRVAQRIGLSRAGQWCVPLLVWLGPAYAVLFSTKERGFYGVALVLAALYPLLVLRLYDELTIENYAWFGAAVGLGFWQSPLTMLVAVPAAAWLVAVRREAIGGAVWAIVPAAFAASPWIVWNLNHDFDSLQGAADFGSTWWDRFFDWLLRLQVVSGLETPFDGGRDLIASRWAGLVLIAALVIVAEHRAHVEAPGLLATLVVGYGALYAVNGLAAGVGEDPRYTYLMVPIVALCIGAVVPDRPTDLQRFGVGLAVCAVVVATTSWGLVGVRDVAEEPYANAFLTTPGIEEVAELLEARGIRYPLTDSAGMQLAFLTDEQVQGASFAVPRVLEYEFAARAADPSTYVLDRGYRLNITTMENWITVVQPEVEVHDLGKWRVYLLDRRVLPEDIGLYVYGGRLSTDGGISWGT